MHLTLKMETTKPAAGNFLQQQAKFDDFIECYNNERPHQALNMQRPAERYLPSTRPYRGLPELDYPFHDRTATVTTCGRICFDRRKINLSVVFAGQSVGIKQVGDEIWLVSLWTMISDTSIRRRADSNQSKIPSDQKCYLCSQHKP
jgi:putative transposase